LAAGELGLDGRCQRTDTERRIVALALKHDHVGISVTDVDAAVEWYSQKLDFSIEHRFETHGLTIAFLINGTAKLELLSGATESSPAITDVRNSLSPARLHHVCIAVDNLDATLEELRTRGVTILGEPFDVPPIGQRVAFISDNSGNVIEITQPGT
jgi:methylmalonyl-CoA epimerase